MGFFTLLLASHRPISYVDVMPVLFCTEHAIAGFSTSVIPAEHLLNYCAYETGVPTNRKVENSQ